MLSRWSVSSRQRGREVRIFRDALAFVQHQNRAGFCGFLEPLRDRGGIPLHRVEPARGPSDEHETATRERRMNERIHHPDRRAKEERRPLVGRAQCLRAAVDLAPDLARTRRTRSVSRGCVCV